MIIDKEYPATHSMSTSWYIVDAEGNVGLMDYDENGPVPWGVEQTCCEELGFGHWEDWANKKITRFNLTDEQILDMFHQPHSPEEEEYWYDCAVKIDKTKKERFLELSKSPKITDFWCISETLELYSFCAHQCCELDKDYKIISITGPLKAMIDEGLIIEVYSEQDYYISCLFGNNHNISHEYNFNNSPYYIYHQPYWTNQLPKKLHTPTHPAKIDQIPEEFRHKIHKIPGKFADIDAFQIAEYHPCDTYSSEYGYYEVNGCLYELLPMSDGTEAYAKIAMGKKDFYPYCTEKDLDSCCLECSKKCSSNFTYFSREFPNIMFIYDPSQKGSYEFDRAGIVKKYEAIGIPLTPKTLPTIKTSEDFIAFFSATKEWLSETVRDINPYAIIISDDALNIIGDSIKMSDNSIEFSGVAYPYFKLSEIDKHTEEISEYNKMPFRGNIYPQVISEDDMDDLINSGQTRNYYY